MHSVPCKQRHHVRRREDPALSIQYLPCPNAAFDCVKDCSMTISIRDAPALRTHGSLPTESWDIPHDASISSRMRQTGRALQRGRSSLAFIYLFGDWDSFNHSSCVLFNHHQADAGLPRWFPKQPTSKGLNLGTCGGDSTGDASIICVESVLHSGPNQIWSGNV